MRKRVGVAAVAAAAVAEEEEEEVVEEEEEVLVVAHFPGLEDVIGTKTTNVKFELDESGSKLHAVIDDHLVFEGKFELNLGTQLLFEEVDHDASSQLPGNLKSAQIMGNSITSVPLELKTTVDIDKINSILAQAAVPGLLSDTTSSDAASG
jgi:hypothetical protein